MSYQRYLKKNLIKKSLIEKPWMNFDSIAKHLESSEFPNEKIEEWKYFNTAKISQGNWDICENLEIAREEFQEENLKNSLVLVNGSYQESSSNLKKINGIKFSTLSNYFKSNPSIKNIIYNSPKKYSEKRISGKIDTDSASLLSLNALLNKGVVIEIEAQKLIKEKINLINIIKGSNLLINPYILIVCKEGSSANIVDIRKYIGDKNWINPCIEVYQYRNSELSFSSIQSVPEENFSTLSFNFHLFEGAGLNMCLLNRENTKTDIRVFLKERNAKAKVNGVLLSNKKQQSDVFCKVQHFEKSCISEQNWRLLSADSSTTSIKGKIVVDKNSKGSIGKFNSKSLILGKKASSHSKPELEIFEDEVACSHGAAFGEIDKSLIFYMQSRGISKNEAIKIIITAFINDVISDDKDIFNRYISEMKDFLEVNLV